MEGGGVGSSSNPCLMGYNNNHHNGFSPLMLMMPQMHSSSSSHPPPPPPAGNTMFLPTHHDLNRDVSSSLMLGENPNLNCSSRDLNTSTGYYFMETANEATNKDKIMAHPHYHRLLSAYSNCQKIGAPPEVVAKLEEACASAAAMGGRHGTSLVGEDPGLDQFMEAYCEMLIKYEQELSKPFKEAMLFLSRIECQFKALVLDPSPSSAACVEGAMVRNNGGSSDEEMDVNIHHQGQHNNKIISSGSSLIDPCAEDRELKGQLLRKYSGYLGNLKQEFMKKRKKGKLPKEARQHLLDWWNRHYKWPYPSESQKVALAEATGLDQKQINNWFINQRKRHWKPSEDMQFVVMDAASSAHHLHHFTYIDTTTNNNNLPFPMDIPTAGLL